MFMITYLFLALLVLALLGRDVVDASNRQGYCRPTARTVVAFSNVPSETVSASRDGLLSYVKELNERRGPFLAVSPDGDELDKLKGMVAELEAVCEPPADAEVDTIVGDWKLLCTTESMTKTVISRPRLPFLSFLSSEDGPLRRVRESVEVVQRIRKGNSDGKSFDRVDNVIEFTPLSSLADLLPSSAYDSVNINPLEVTKSKVSLVHKAEVESVSPVLRTKLVLESIVLTVAGTSQFLEPDGADVLGLNLPFGDLFNFGSFDTTYVDDELRISRGKIGLVDKLRVFVRESPSFVEADVVPKQSVPTPIDAELEEQEVDESSLSSSVDDVLPAEEETAANMKDDETSEGEKDEEDTAVATEEETEEEEIEDEGED